MSVEVTRLPSGLTVVTDAMPHLETASLGVWVGAGSRDERAGRARHLASARAHGVQGHRRGAPRARSPRRSRRSAAISMPRPRSRPRPITRACCGPTCRSRSTCCPTSSPIRPSIRRSCSASRTSSCRRSARPRTRPTISCSTICRRPRFPTSRSAARSSARRETVRSFDRTRLRAYLARNYRAPDMVVAAAGAVDHAAIVDEVERRFASFAGPRRRRRSPRALSAAPISRRAISSRCMSRSALRGPAAARSRLCSACRCSPACSAAACRRGCSRKCARSAGSATRSTRSTRPIPDTGMFGLYAGTDAADVPELMRVVVDEIDAAAGDHHRGRGRARQGADEGGAADGAGELRRARRAAGAPDVRLGPADAAGRDRRQDRGGDGRERARRRPRADRARPAGDRRARARHGLESAATIAESLVRERHKRRRMAKRSDRCAIAVVCSSSVADPWRSSAPSACPNRCPRSRATASSCARRRCRTIAEWAALREASRDFLTPWEPTWPADDLTRAAFRRRIKRYAEDQRSDLAYPFFMFRKSDKRLVGGLTLANIRRGVAQAGSLGYWMGAPYARQGYMTAAVQRVRAVRFRDAAAAPASRPPAFPPISASIRLAGKDRLPARGLCPRISLHQRHLAGPPAVMRGCRDDPAPDRCAPLTHAGRAGGCASWDGHDRACYKGRRESTWLCAIRRPAKSDCAPWLRRRDLSAPTRSPGRMLVERHYRAGGTSRCIERIVHRLPTGSLCAGRNRRAGCNRRCRVRSRPIARPSISAPAPRHCSQSPARAGSDRGRVCAIS